MNGAKLLIACMGQQGIDTLHYLCGIPNRYLIHEASISGMQMRQSTHEGACVYAAAGAYMACGETQVALVTAGPGVTNALSAISELYQSRIPVLLIYIQNDTREVGLGVHHDSTREKGVDVKAMLQCVTHSSYHPQNSHDCSRDFLRAYRDAQNSSRPCAIGIAQNLLYEACSAKAEYSSDGEKGKTQKNIILGEKDFVILGNLSAKQSLEMRSLLEEKNAFYGAISQNSFVSGNSTFFLGFADLLYNEHIAQKIAESERVYLLGNNFSKYAIEQLLPEMGQQKIIHISNDESEAFYGAYELYEFENSDEIILELRAKQESASFLEKGKTQFSESEYFSLFQELGTLDAGAFYVSVGDCDLHAKKFLRPINYAPTIYCSNFFAMGKSLMAIGHACEIQQSVVAVCGDGDFVMNWLALSAKGIPRNVRVIVVNNGGYASLESGFEQQHRESHDSSETFQNLDHISISHLCQGMGVLHERVFPDKVEKIREIINQEYDRVIVIEYMLSGKQL